MSRFSCSGSLGGRLLPCGEKTCIHRQSAKAEQLLGMFAALQCKMQQEQEHEQEQDEDEDEEEEDEEEDEDENE